MPSALRWPCVALAANLAVVLACDGPPDGGDEPEVAPDVPDTAVCEPVADWPEAWADAERAVVAEINALREEGGWCGPLHFAPAPPLRMHSSLRCAARLHTADMIAREYLSSVDPDGLGLGARLLTLEYAAATFAEVVAVVTEDTIDDDDDVRDIVVAWRDNPTSCWQLHARELTHVGVGGREATFMPKEADAPSRAGYWTLSLAAPR